MAAPGGRGAAFCNNCGTRLREGARFCDNCGAAVRSAAAPAATVGAPAQNMAAVGMLPAQDRSLEGMQRQNEATPLIVCRRSAVTYLLHPLPWFLWGIFVAAVVAFVIWQSTLLLIVMGVCLILAAASLLIWWIDRLGDSLTVYPDRIVRHEGIFNRTEVVNPIWRIQDVTIKQKWYGFGWIYLETAGDESDQGFGPTRDAAHVRDILYHLMRPSS